MELGQLLQLMEHPQQELVVVEEELYVELVELVEMVGAEQVLQVLPQLVSQELLTLEVVVEEEHIKIVLLAELADQV